MRINVCITFCSYLDPDPHRCKKGTFSSILVVGVKLNKYLFFWIVKSVICAVDKKYLPYQICRIDVLNVQVYLSYPCYHMEPLGWVGVCLAVGRWQDKHFLECCRNRRTNCVAVLAHRRSRKFGGQLTNIVEVLSNCCVCIL